VNAATAGAVLQMRGVGLAYGGRHVLHDLSLELGRGQRAALLGPNGAGKSSLLRAITGTDGRREGSITLDGVPLEEYGRSALARCLAVVPGQTTVAFPLRVEELVGLGRIPHEDPFRGPRAADRLAVEAAIERVGIRHLVGRDVRELSLGERQLAVLAMAVAQGARLLLLDEPTVHLDLRHQLTVMELLADLAERDGVTVLAVLHDIALARHFFPRLLLLSEGRLVADGPPSQVMTAERVRAVYGVDAGAVPGLIG
jgi:iron complex transport system ATP-binding protein